MHSYAAFFVITKKQQAERPAAFGAEEGT